MSNSTRAFELAEFPGSRQAAACVDMLRRTTIAANQKRRPARIHAHEGIATITANALAKDAPHPNAARLFYRWSASAKGKKLMLREAACHRIRRWTGGKASPCKLYPIGTEEIAQWPKYEKTWKEIFSSDNVFRANTSLAG